MHAELRKVLRYILKLIFPELFIPTQAWPEIIEATHNTEFLFWAIFLSALYMNQLIKYFLLVFLPKFFIFEQFSKIWDLIYLKKLILANFKRRASVRKNSVLENDNKN